MQITSNIFLNHAKQERQLYYHDLVVIASTSTWKRSGFMTLLPRVVMQENSARSNGCELMSLEGLTMWCSVVCAAMRHVNGRNMGWPPSLICITTLVGLLMPLEIPQHIWDALLFMDFIVGLVKSYDKSIILVWSTNCPSMGPFWHEVTLHCQISHWSFCSGNRPPPWRAAGHHLGSGSHVSV